MCLKCIRCHGEAEYVIDGFSLCENCFKIYIKEKIKKKEREIEI